MADWLRSDFASCMSFKGGLLPSGYESMKPGVNMHKILIFYLSDIRVSTPLSLNFYPGIARVTLRNRGLPRAKVRASKAVQAHIRCHSSGFIKKKSFTGILATAIVRLQASGLFDMKSKSQRTTAGSH
jgi:hypothetical protein